MFGSVVLFIYTSGNQPLYILVAVLFGIGYGASYPILAAMAANDADKKMVPQTLQLFALTYFVGIFGFPLIAGWMITEMSVSALLVVVAVMSFIEATMALLRHLSNTSNS
jgi:MFS family permease